MPSILDDNATQQPDQSARDLKTVHSARDLQGPARQVDQAALAAYDFTGYHTPKWVAVVYATLVVMTGGLVWVVVQCLSSRPVWTMQQCTLKDAQHVQVKLIGGERKMAKVFQHLQHPVHQSQGVSQSKHAPHKFLLVHLMVYIYDAKADIFTALPDIPKDLPKQIQTANAALRMIAAGLTALMALEVRLISTFDVMYGTPTVPSATMNTTGSDWSAFNALSSWSRKDRACLYGSNDVAAGCPNLLKMAAGHLAQAIYIVQFVEIAFITYEGDYKLAALLAAVTLVSCFAATSRLYGSRMKLYQSVAQRRLVPILHAGRVRAVSSHRLVPGDVIILLPGKATCDMVLLRGSCLVEESLLSGEAAQVRKSSIGGLGLGGYHPNTHHAYTVHSGTNVEQVWNEEDAEDEILAMVARTGLFTSMGAMMRQVVYNIVPVREQFIRDYFIFCTFHLVLQLAGFALFMAKANEYEDDWQDAFQRVVDIFIAAWPMSAPTVLIVALGVRVVRLKSCGIDTLQPAKLQAAANTEIVCFDKTGTLTANSTDLHGMLPVVGGQFLSLQSDAMRWPNGLRQAAAVCNSLTLIGKSKVVGELGERRAFNGVEAHFLDHNVVTLPLQTTHGRQHRQATMHILKRFEFEPSLMRSGVVAVERSHGKRVSTGVLIVKGAAPAIEQQIGADRLPPNYRKLVDEWSGKSFRVLAVALAEVSHVSKLDLASMNQEQVERHATSFNLAGLIVYSNFLNSDSAATVKQLQERGGLRLMMVTGDYHHTAIAVSRGVGMIPTDSRVVVIQTCKERQGTAKILRPKPEPPLASNTHKAQHRPDLPSVSFAADEQSSEYSPQEDEQSLSQGWVSPQSRAESFSSQHDMVQAPGDLRSRLVFTLDSGDPFEGGDTLKAFNTISQGAVQCCITGPAFEYLVQQPNQALIHAVLLNSVAFTRMRSHQKGQLMDLLGSKGLHQWLNGQRHHIAGLGKSCLYCGDGINDLAALAAADIGMAVGSAEASAAATFSDKHYSVAGVCSVLKEARALQVISVAVVKFLVLYQLADQMSVNVTFFVDGSGYSNDQSDAFDMIALAIGIIATLRPAASVLFPTRRLPRLSQLYSWSSVIWTAVFIAVMYIVIFQLLDSQSWYTGGNGDDAQNPVITVVWSLCLVQVIVPAVMFPFECHPYCKKANIPEMIVVYALLIYMSLCCLLSPGFYDANNIFGFYSLPFSFTYKLELICLVCTVGYVSVLIKARRLVSKYEERRVHVAPRTSSLTES